MSIVDWIYPKWCVGCRAEGQYICDECRTQIIRMGESLRYQGIVRKVIKEIKYRGTYDMVRELVEVWNPQYKTQYEGSFVTSVPMWQNKERERGFNQAELLARELARRWSLDYVTILRRVRETLPMYGLDRTRRLANVKGAFEMGAHKLPLNAHNIILVDDVWTTGATMEECAKVLGEHGAQKIWFLTAAA